MVGGLMPQLNFAFPANWCFSPVEYQGCLFWPVSNNGGSEYGGYCYIYVYNGNLMWPDDIYGVGTEDVVKLIPYYTRLYSLCESWKMLKVKTALPCMWGDTFQMGPKATCYGAFDGCVHKGNLYIPISGYDPGTPIVLWRHDGAVFTSEGSLFYAPDESVRAWACGSDGENLYFGIAGRGRGISVDTSKDGIYRRDIYTTLHHESAAKAQCFVVLPNGEVLAGCTGGAVRARRGGAWDIIFNTGAQAVESLEVINGELWIGTSLPGKVFRVSLTTWNFQAVSGSFGEVARIGVYKGTPVVASYESGQALIRSI